MMRTKAGALSALMIFALLLGACAGPSQNTGGTSGTGAQGGSAATSQPGTQGGGLSGSSGNAAPTTGASGGAATSAPAGAAAATKAPAAGATGTTAPAAGTSAPAAAATGTAAPSGGAGATPTVPSLASVKVGAPGTVTMTVVRGAMMDTVRKLADKYEQSHQGTKIQVVEEPEGGAFQALIAAGNQPDIVTLSVGTQVGDLAAQNALIPIEDLAGASDLLNSLQPEITQKLYGHNYYVPAGADVTLLIYNKDLFKEAGLDPAKPPQTWDEFLADAQKISALPNRPSGDKTYGTVFWNDALAWGGWYWNLLMPIYLNANQNQCLLLNKLGTDIVYDQPQCKMADFFGFAQKAQKFAPPTMAKDFFSRSVGMWPQYGYSWEPNLKTAKDKPMVIGQDVAVAPAPVPQAGQTSYTTLGGRLFSIMKTTPQRQQMAWDFVKFLMQPENNLQFDKELGYLPVSKSLMNDAYFQDPARKPFVDALQHAVLPEQFATADKVANAVLGVYQKVVVQGSETPDQGVQDAATAGRAALQQKK